MTLWPNSILATGAYVGPLVTAKKLTDDW